MKSIITVSLLVFSLMAYSQQPTIAWQKCIGGTAGEYGWSLKELGDGNLIGCGYTDSNDGDFSGNHGNDDAVVYKLSPDGTVLWTKLYGGTEDEEATDIEITNDGGFIFTGTTYSNDGDVSGNHGDNDIWVVKTDASGNVSWQKCFGGSYDERGETIIQTSDGGYIFLGSAYSTDGDVSGIHGNSYTDIWAVKINSSGTIEWQKCFGGNDAEEGYSVAEAANGDFIIAGYTSSNDGDVSGNNGGRDSWVLRVSSSGSIIWQKCLGGANTEEFNSIYLNNDGTIMTLGYSNSSSGDLAGAGGHGDDDFWVVKLGSDGTKIFSKCYGGPYADQANKMAKTYDGNYVLCGLATANGGDISGLHSSALGPDIWVTKINPDGLLLWQKCLGGYNQDEGLFITATADGNCIASGFTYSGGGDVSGLHGNKDIWLVKLSGGASSTDENIISNFTVFPNPATNKIYFDKKLSDIVVYDPSGRIVESLFNSEVTELDISFLKPGIYFLFVNKLSVVKFSKGL